jgi:hypothetical protein
MLHRGVDNTAAYVANRTCGKVGPAFQIWPSQQGFINWFLALIGV